MNEKVMLERTQKMKQFRIFGKFTILQTMLFLGAIGIASTIVYQLVQ